MAGDKLTSFVRLAIKHNNTGIPVETLVNEMFQSGTEAQRQRRIGLVSSISRILSESSDTDEDRLRRIRDSAMAIVDDPNASPSERAAAGKSARDAMSALQSLRPAAKGESPQELLTLLAVIRRSTQSNVNCPVSGLSITPRKVRGYVKG